MTQSRGNREQCYYCGKGPARRYGISYLCDVHKVIFDIVHKAQSPDILITICGEFYDYNADEFRRYIERKLKMIGVA